MKHLFERLLAYLERNDRGQAAIRGFAAAQAAERGE